MDSTDQANGESGAKGLRGILLPEDAPCGEFARDSEDRGFDLLGCGEHVMFHGKSANAFVRLAYAAGATQRIGLLSAVTQAPLYQPGMLAKLIAEITVMSEGRFNFGVGVGGEYAPEFDMCGIRLSNRGRRTDEALEVVSLLLGSRSASYAGDFSSFKDASIQPWPETSVPIWVGGRGESAMRRAARFSDYWFPYMYTPEQLAGSRLKVARYALEQDRDPAQVRTATFLWVGVGRDGLAAHRTAVRAVGKMYQQDFSTLAKKYLVTGTPQQCGRRIREYEDAGAEAIVLAFAGTTRSYREMLDLLVEGGCC